MYSLPAKGDEIGATCSTQQKRNETPTELESENLKGRDHFRDTE
jgi:hypothetical protein